jgi:hypothetical protein
MSKLDLGSEKRKEQNNNAWRHRRAKIHEARLTDSQTAVIATDEGLIKWKFAEKQIEFLAVGPPPEKMEHMNSGSDQLECVMNDDIAVFYMRNF